MNNQQGGFGWEGGSFGCSFKICYEQGKKAYKVAAAFSDMNRK